MEINESGKILRGKIQKILGELPVHAREYQQENENPNLHGNSLGSSENPDLSRLSGSISNRKVVDILSMIESHNKSRISPWSTSLDAGGFSKVEILAKLETAQMELQQRESQVRELTAKIESMSREHTLAIEHLESEHSGALRVLEKGLSNSLDKKLEVIEKLLREKAQMTNRLEELIREKKDLEVKLSAKQERNEELFRREFAREKESFISVEKANRVKWEQKRIAEIKEQTIKSLEPEIEKIISVHKQEKKLMEMKHSEEIEKQRAESNEYFKQEQAAVREKAAHDIREAIEKERCIFLRKESERFDSHVSELNVERRKRIEELNQVRLETEQILAHEKLVQSREIEKIQDDADGRIREEISKREIIIQERVDKEVETAKENQQHEVERLRAEMEAQKETQIEDILEKLSLENMKMIEEAKVEERRKYEALIEARQEDIKRLQNDLQQAKCDNDISQENVKAEETKVEKIREVLRAKNEEIFETSQKFIQIQSELDQVKFEKLSLINQLKIADNSLEAFKASELAKIESRVNSLIESKHHEIDQLKERNTYLEAKNSALSEALAKTRHHN